MKKFISVILCIAIAISLCPLYASSSGDELITYPEYDSRITKCYDYGVSVTQAGNTENLIVYNRADSMEFLTGRTAKADYNRRFCEFAFSGSTVRIDITPYFDFTAYNVIPGNKNYRTSCSDGVISVWVDKNDEFVLLRLNNDDSTILSVFADAPENYDFDKTDSSVLVFDDPWTDYTSSDGYTAIGDNIKKIYIAPGCVLNSKLYSDSDNLEICGHGILLDPYSNIYDFDCTSQNQLLGIEGTDAKVRDIKLLDAQGYNLAFGKNASGCSAENVKILSSRMNTDGVSGNCTDLTVNHCFIYVGDNAVVFSSGAKGSAADGTNSVYSHCLIGTTCAAIFPQNDTAYPVKFIDNTVFRADEGIINHGYNYGSKQRAMGLLGIDGLYCTDMLNMPWLFCGKNMGSLEKNVSFKNVYLPASHGSSLIGDAVNGLTVIIAPESGSSLGYSNVNFTISDLYVDGKKIENESQLVKSIPDGADADFTFEEAETPSDAALKRTDYTADYVYEGKVFIGRSLQAMQTQPVYMSGEWYLPYYEICSKLGIKASGNTELISLTELGKIVTAAYDGSLKAIVITPEKTYANLFCDNSASDGFARFEKVTSYASQTGTVTENGSTCYHVITTASSGAAGAAVRITDEIKKYAGETFTIGFDAKSYDGTSQSGTIAFGGNNLNGIIKSKSVQYSADWQHYRLTFDTQNIDSDSADIFYFLIRNAKSEKMNILFKNVTLSLYNENASENPCSNVKINVAPARNFDWGTKITIKATAQDVPSGYYLAVYIDGRQVASQEGGSGLTTVSYDAGKLTGSINYTVKVTDAAGTVQTDAYGDALSADGGTIKCSKNIFKMIIAFFKGLFGSLPKAVAEPAEQ